MDNNITQIQQLVQKFIATKLQSDVVKRVEAKLQNMDETQLRSVLKKVLQKNSNLYIQLLGEE